MQPVQIGMNAAVVLLALLLAVPAQLIISHYMEQLATSAEEIEGEGGGGVGGGNQMRQDAVERLGDLAHNLVGKVESTVAHYSTWRNLKELVMVPYRKKAPAANTIRLQSTIINSGRGITTIQLSPVDSSKKKEGKGGKGGSLAQKSAGGREGSRGAETQSSQHHRSTQPITKPTSRDPPVVEPTSPAHEVIAYLMKEVYFAQSKDPRAHRPAALKHVVGQVVRHKQDGYLGVIVGWDKKAMAPDEWIEKHYSSRKHIVDTPHYLVLVDSHYDVSATPFSYLPQEDIEMVTNTQVHCPEVADYFEGYKNGRHIPKPWLQVRYPRD